MQILSCPVSTYCVGLAASGGAILLAGGTTGKRFALPNSKVMIHQPYGGVGGQVSDIEIQADEILRNRQVLNEILATHTGKDAETIKADMDRDFFEVRIEFVPAFSESDHRTAHRDGSAAVRAPTSLSNTGC